MVFVFMEGQIMLNKENPNYSSGSTTEKETEPKQFAKPGGKGESGHTKPIGKPQQNKVQPGSKPGHKECSGISKEDEECESWPKTDKSCN
jgi:hypothetical protein